MRWVGRGGEGGILLLSIASKMRRERSFRVILTDCYGTVNKNALPELLERFLLGLSPYSPSHHTALLELRTDSFRLGWPDFLKITYLQSSTIMVGGTRPAELG